jgi:hypothetical protein
VALQRRRDAAPQKAPGDYLDKLIKFESRLVPVDASTDSTELRRASGPPAVLHRTGNGAGAANGRSADKYVACTCRDRHDRAADDYANSPARFRDLLVKLGPSDFVAQRYTVKVAFGRRHEQWILAIDPIGAAATSH